MYCIVSRTFQIALFVVLAFVAGWFVWQQQRERQHLVVAVKVPELSEVAIQGKKFFDTHCITCHGPNGAGTNQGPPLIHKIYEPNHHSDKSFYRAAANGVNGHHWPFGNMPPVETVKQDEVTKIITYVRELQKANGIF